MQCHIHHEPSLWSVKHREIKNYWGGQSAPYIKLIKETIKEDRVLNYIWEGIIGLYFISIILFTDKW